MADKKWADIENMDWGDHPADTRKTIEDHCDFKYLAHVEGGSSSGRLKQAVLKGQMSAWADSLFQIHSNVSVCDCNTRAPIC